MNQIASRGQLRWAFVRRVVVTVPLLLLLGFAAGRLAPAGAANGWYAALDKPAFTPPDGVFPAVWGAVYALMGVALAMVLDARRARGRGRAVGLFAVTVAAALAWMPLFFGFHRVVAALVLLAVILLLGVATTLAFARIRPRAALLMLPFVAWVAFAGALTWGIHVRNPAAGDLDRGDGATQIAL